MDETSWTYSILINYVQYSRRVLEPEVGRVGAGILTRVADPDGLRFLGSVSGSNFLFIFLFVKYGFCLIQNLGAKNDLDCSLLLYST